MAGPWGENQDMSGYKSSFTLCISIYSLYHAEQTTGLRAPPYAVLAGIHQPQSEVRCTPGAHTSGDRSPEGTRWLLANGWSSELQHGPPRQSVGQISLSSPTRQAPGHHKIPPPLCPVCTTLRWLTGAVSLPGCGPRQWLKGQESFGGLKKLGRGPSVTTPSFP